MASANSPGSKKTKAAREAAKVKAKERRAERRVEEKAKKSEAALAIPGSAQAEDVGAKGPSAVRLAQIVNLHLAGYSFAEIGAAIGASADEVDRMINLDATRYVRNQPQLRTWVRNWTSGKYATLLEAVWDEASAKPGEVLEGHSKPVAHRERMDSQDRALRILDSMRKLHGADAPTQAEVKIEAAPEAVEALVNALSAANGLGYDETIFDIDAEVVHEAVEQSAEAERVSGNAVGHDADGDAEWER